MNTINNLPNKLLIVIDNKSKYTEKNKTIKDWLSEKDRGISINLKKIFMKQEQDYDFIVFAEETTVIDTFRQVESFFSSNKGITETYEEFFIIIHFSKGHDDLYYDDLYDDYLYYEDFKDKYKNIVPGKIKIRTQSHIEESFYDTIMPNLIDENQSVNFSEIASFFFNEELESRLRKPFQDKLEHQTDVNINILDEIIKNIIKWVGEEDNDCKIQKEDNGRCFVLTKKDEKTSFLTYDQLIKIIKNKSVGLPKNNIALLLEQKSNEKNYHHQDFLGIEMIYKLRKDLRFNKGIFIFSFVKESEIGELYKQSQRSREFPARILKTTGIFYHELSFKENVLEVERQDEIKKEVSYYDNFELTGLDLENSIRFSLNYDYLLSTYLHDYSDKSDSNLHDKIFKITKPENKEDVRKIIESPENHQDFNEKLKPYLFNFEENDNTSKKKLDDYWGVLIVDDNKKDCDRLKECLINTDRVKEENIYTYSTFDEYYKFHTAYFGESKDSNFKSIGWVISDLRLLDENEKEWPYSGNYILSEFEDQFVSSLCAISNSTTRSNTVSLKKTDIKVYSKKNLLGSDYFFESFTSHYVGITNNKNKPSNGICEDLPESWMEETVKYGEKETCLISDFYKEAKKIFLKDLVRSTDFDTMNTQMDTEIIDGLKNSCNQEANETLISEVKYLDTIKKTIEGNLHNEEVVNNIVAALKENKNKPDIQKIFYEEIETWKSKLHQKIVDKLNILNNAEKIFNGVYKSFLEDDTINKSSKQIDVLKKIAPINVFESSKEKINVLIYIGETIKNQVLFGSKDKWGGYIEGFLKRRRMVIAYYLMFQERLDLNMLKKETLIKIDNKMQNSFRNSCGLTPKSLKNLFFKNENVYCINKKELLKEEICFVKKIQKEIIRAENVKLKDSIS